MGDIDKIADKIVYEIDKAVREVQENVQRKWKKDWKPRAQTWQQNRTTRDFQSAANRFRKVPAGLSDLANEGSCVMRYMSAYALKAWAFFFGLGGLIIVVDNSMPQNKSDWQQVSIGLCLLIAAQLIWWAGRRVQKSADRKKYAKDQHRLLRLAREKEGNLTVLEAATDGRMTAERAEEILRELAVRGHVEVRVSDSGMMVYHFPEIARWDEKNWAKPVDEL